jgi:probable HAF family extracellular repeat protein
VFGYEGSGDYRKACCSNNSNCLFQNNMRLSFYEAIMKIQVWTRSFKQGMLIAGVIYVLPLAVAFGQVTYKITDLGSLGGGSSNSQSINELGQVVGESSLPDGSYHAFIYTGGKMRDLGIGASTASCINNLGEVVGDYNGQAFIYRSGKMHLLGTLGGSQFVKFSYATCINNSGEVTGGSTIPSPAFYEHVTVHAFLYGGGKMRDLGTLGNAAYSINHHSAASSINDRGQVVGESDIPPGSFFNHAFLYSGGTMRDLGALGSDPSTTYSSASCINDHAQIVGSSATTPYSGNYHAFLYSGTKMLDLGTLGGSTSYAYSINNSGAVVGESATADGGQVAFLYRGGQMLDLNTLIAPNSGVSLARATSINDAGQIVAWVNANGGRLFLLTPVRPGIRP